MRINPRVCSRWQAREIDAFTAFDDLRLRATDLISAKDISATVWAPAHRFLSAQYSSHFCKADNFRTGTNITVSGLSEQMCQCLRSFCLLFSSHFSSPPPESIRPESGTPTMCDRRAWIRIALMACEENACVINQSIASSSFDRRAASALIFSRPHAVSRCATELLAVWRSSTASSVSICRTVPRVSGYFFESWNPY
jgi:hypothetical protein